MLTYQSTLRFSHPRVPCILPLLTRCPHPRDEKPTRRSSDQTSKLKQSIQTSHYRHLHRIFRERKIQSNPLLLIETVRRVGVGGSERARCEASSRGWRGSVLEYVTEPDKARNEAKPLQTERRVQTGFELCRGAAGLRRSQLARYHPPTYKLEMKSLILEYTSGADCRIRKLAWEYWALSKTLQNCAMASR